MDTVLSLMDKNGDGKISVDELKALGLDGLPNFEDLGAEGHHYDVESGAFCTILSIQGRFKTSTPQNSSFTTRVRPPEFFSSFPPTKHPARTIPLNTRDSD